jgi:mannosyltransferase OCH1-like enzyme
MLIHRYWTGPDRPPHEPWLQYCFRSLNPGVDINEWKDNDLPTEYSKFVNKSQVRYSDEYRHKANIVRLLLLLDFGGAWYDYDVVPLLPVASLPFPSVGYHRGLCNSFMYFGRGDQRLEDALEGIQNQPPSERPSTVVSGSMFLRDYLPEVQYLEYPFGPTGQLLHGNRPFAIHLGGGSC